MLRTILVPLDGSALAERALPHACRFARATDAQLLLLHILRDTAGDNDLANEGTNVDEDLQGIWQRLTREGFSVRVEVREGDPVPVIEDAAHTHGADLIVMTTPDHSGLERLLQRPVAERVLQRTAVPLMFIHEHTPAPDEASGPLRRILVGLDGTPFAEAALTYLAQAEMAAGAELLLLRAVPPATGAGARNPLEPHSRLQLDHVHLTIEQARLEAEVYLAAAGKRYLDGRLYRIAAPVAYPAKAILDLAATQHADLIVMATHGRGGLERLIHTSVPGHVLHHTAVPLLLLHTTDPVHPQLAASLVDDMHAAKPAISPASGMSLEV